MKQKTIFFKSTLLAFLLFSAAAVKSQVNVVDNLKIYPDNPKVGENVYLVADVWLTFCDWFIDANVLGNSTHDLQVYGCYTRLDSCNFPAVYISSDTIDLGVFNETGNYSISYYLYQMTAPVFGCTAMADNDTISFNLTTTGIEEKNNMNFVLHPNPAKDFVDVAITNGFSQELQVSVYNLLGKKMKSTYGSRIELAGLTKGYYFVKLFDESGNEGIQKLLVN